MTDGSVHYDRQEMACVSCSAKSSTTPLFVLVGALAAVAIVSVCLCLGKRRAKRRQREGESPPRARSWWKRHANSIKNRLKIKIKILFTFYQIATKVGETYLMTFPPTVERTLEVFSFTNLELDGLGLPLACMGLSGFKNKLLFMILAPVGVLLCTKLIGAQRGCARRCSRFAANGFGRVRVAIVGAFFGGRFFAGFLKGPPPGTASQLGKLS